MSRKNLFMIQDAGFMIDDSSCVLHPVYRASCIMIIHIFLSCLSIPASLSPESRKPFVYFFHFFLQFLKEIESFSQWGRFATRPYFPVYLSYSLKGLFHL